MQATDIERILVDVDGTLCWNLPRICEFVDREYGVEVTPAEIDAWDYRFEPAGVDIDEVIGRLFTDHPEWFLSDLEPVPGARQALEMLSTAGHEIQIVTHRPAETHHLTRQWLDDYGFTYDQFVSDVPANKAEVPGDVLVDDYHGHVADAADAGMLGVLFDRPYSEPVDRERAIRVSTWSDVLETLELEPELLGTDV